MLNWVLDSVPVWAWLVLAAVPLALTAQLWLPLAVALWRALPGPVRWVLGGALAAALAYLTGRRGGRRRALEEQRRRDAEAARRRQETDREVDRMTPEERSRERRRWERD